jgi:hypothetical protein
MRRWSRFLIAILVGIGVGLLYGWLISPVRYVETTPDTLHMQYKTDYVLMAAEVYNADKNLETAVRRLGTLGNTSPSDMVYQAIVFAQKAGYADADLALMQNLLNAVQVLDFLRQSPQETPQP